MFYTFIGWYYQKRLSERFMGRGFFSYKIILNSWHMAQCVIKLTDTKRATHCRTVVRKLISDYYYPNEGHPQFVLQRLFLK